jgi:hypothetical protein
MALKLASLTQQNCASGYWIAAGRALNVQKGNETSWPSALIKLAIYCCDTHRVVSTPRVQTGRKRLIRTACGLHTQVSQVRASQKNKRIHLKLKLSWAGFGSERR